MPVRCNISSTPTAEKPFSVTTSVPAIRSISRVWSLSRCCLGGRPRPLAVCSSFVMALFLDWCV